MKCQNVINADLSEGLDDRVPEKAAKTDGWQMAVDLSRDSLSGLIFTLPFHDIQDSESYGFYTAPFTIIYNTVIIEDPV